MIGHETVRRNFEAPLARRSQKLRSHELERAGVDEGAMAFNRAEGQEIGLLSGIGEVRVMRRVRVCHRWDGADYVPGSSA
jgi:hypothetical protein